MWDRTTPCNRAGRGWMAGRRPALALGVLGDSLGASRCPEHHILGCTGSSTASSARDGVLHLSLALETCLGLGSHLGLPSTTRRQAEMGNGGHGDGRGWSVGHGRVCGLASLAGKRDKVSFRWKYKTVLLV